MVFERFLDAKFVMKRPVLAFIFGLLYTFVGYALAILFFGKNVSVAMLFMATLLLVPSLIKLISIEEKRVRADGIKRFYHDHKDIFEIYFFLFVGIFIGYLILGMLFTTTMPGFESSFNFQLNFLEKQQGLSKELIEKFKEEAVKPTFDQFVGILSSNLAIALIAFGLSIFYGAGAIFLVVMNASVFSIFILYVMRYSAETLSNSLAILGTFSLHLIPELCGFLLAAIAGGVISKALLKEKIGSESFRNVIKDGTVLLLTSFGLIILGALIEVFLTTRIMHLIL